MAGLSFEEEAIARATYVPFPGNAELNLCSAEDLIVMKSFAGRAKDWMDVDGVIARQSGKLDWGYIYRQLGPLVALKETPDHLEKLKKRQFDFEN